MNKINWLRGLASVNTLSFSALQLVLATLYPFIAERSGLDVATVIACFSAGSLCFLWGSPFWAARGDFLGRQKVIRFGVSGLFFSLSLVLALVFTGATLTATVATALLLASRLAYGFTASAIVPSSQALQADLADPGQMQKAMFTHSLSLNMGRVAGPLLVVLLATRTDLVLWVSLGWAGLLVLANRATPDLIRPVMAPVSDPPSLTAVLKTVFGVFLVALAFTTFVEALNSSLAATLRGTFLYSAADASSFMARLILFGGVVMLITQFGVRQWLRWTWQRNLVVGTGALVLGALLLLQASAPAALWPAIAVLSVALGLVPPAYMTALSHVGPEDGRHGGRAGWLGTAHTLGYALGGALAAMSLRFGVPVNLLLLILSAFVVAAAMRLLRHPRAVALKELSR